MKKLLRPTHYVDNVYDINIKYLVNQGVKLAIFDLDNTLARNDQHKPSARVKTLLKNFKDAGIDVMIMSNNSSKRVEKFCRKLDIFRIGVAMKPLGFSFFKAMKHFEIKDKKSIVMIGDQIMTDVIFANTNKIRSILVRPISIAADAKITGWNRRLEKRTLSQLDKSHAIDKVDILKG